MRQPYPFPRGENDSCAVKLYPEMIPVSIFVYQRPERRAAGQGPPARPAVKGAQKKRSTLPPLPSGASSVSKGSPTGPRCEPTLVELGAWRIKSLRRKPFIRLFPWTAPNDIPKSDRTGKRAERSLARAHFYQSLLDNGTVKNRAELSRYLGVSHARVTQVLRRLAGRSSLLDGTADRQPTRSHHTIGDRNGEARDERYFHPTPPNDPLSDQANERKSE